MSRISAFLDSHCWWVVAAILVLRFLAAATFPVFYKEAYFWEWSRFPSLGYLDHPPMVAWIMKAFSLWLPDRSPLTIRCGALVFGAATLALIYRLAHQLFSDHALAARAVVLACSVPLLNAVGILMVPDAPLVFFHLLALSLFVSALGGGKNRDWYLAGAAMGLALLSKLMAMVAVLGMILFLIYSKEQRAWLKRKEPYLALAVVIAVFSPFLYWNLQHDWANFALQFWDRHRTSFGFAIGKVVEFGFEQLVDTFLLSVPLLASLFVRGEDLPPPWRPWYRLLQWQSLTTLGVFLLAGAVTETHPHWTVLAYAPAAITLAAWWSSQPTRGLASRLNALVPVALITVLLVMSLMPLARPIVMNFAADNLGARWSKKIDTARVRMFGWPELVEQLEERLHEIPRTTGNRDGLIFTDSYKAASMLSFYRDHDLVVSLDAYRHVPKLVGDAAWHYLPTENLKGASGIFATSNRGIGPDELRQVFSNVIRLADIEKRTAGQIITLYSVFRVEGFLAAMEPDGGERRPGRAHDVPGSPVISSVGASSTNSPDLDAQRFRMRD